MSEEDFDEQRESVLITYEEKDKNLKEQFDRYWAELVKHKYIFDRQDIECELLENLTLDEFKEHFNEMFEHQSARRLTINYHSKQSKPD